MKIEIDKEWCMKMAELEDGQEVSAGALDLPDVVMSKIAQRLVKKNDQLERAMGLLERAMWSMDIHNPTRVPFDEWAAEYIKLKGETE